MMSLCWLTGLLSDTTVSLCWLTGLLSDTVMSLCWLTGLLSDTVIMLTDLLLETMMFLCWLFDTKMTDLLSETMMFLCWLTARCHTMMSLMIMMTVWWTCCETLMSLYWLTETVRDHVFMLTVWQTCCETLMFLYWLLMDLSETMMFLCCLTDLLTETVMFLRWLFDRPAVRDCDVSPSLHAGVHGQGARGVWLLNSVAPGYCTGSAGGPPATAQGQHVTQGHADPAAAEVHLLQVRQALLCPGECLKWFWKSLFKALKRDFRTQGLYEPYLHINIWESTTRHSVRKFLKMVALW